MTVTDINQLVQRFDQAAKMMKTVARGGVPNIPGMGPVPGAGRPGASSKRGKQVKSRSGSRSGNPAKRAAENAGIAAQATEAPAGSGFGLGGGAKGAPSAEDLAELQRMLGRG
jgi:signal recognition particle subunit SRP54